MNILVTGGNRGLGLHLTQLLNAKSISRSNGIDITKNCKEIADQSLQYDVFINNAFDGPPQESWANFGQVQVYMAVYDAWKNNDKSGWIINVGSVGEKTIVAPEPRFETYRISKAALSHASRQGTQSFKQNIVKFKTTLVSIDRLDTELSRNRPSWTGNGQSLLDISNFIQFGLSCNANTCIEEITFYCNFNFKA